MPTRESVQGMIDGLALITGQLVLQRSANGPESEMDVADASLRDLVFNGDKARAIAAASGAAGVAARWMQQVLAQCDPDLDDPMAFAEDVLRDYAVQLQGMLDAAT